MGGIYGEFLDFFPELFDLIKYYVKEPKVNSGYEIKEEGFEDGIVMTEKTFIARIGKKSRTDENDLLSYSDKEYLFAPADSKFRVGLTIIHPGENVEYAIVSKADWDKEAGFTRFDIEIVQGSTGSEDEEVPVLKPGVF